MKSYKINLNNLKKFLKNISSKANLLVPCKDKYGDIYYSLFDEEEDIYIKNFKPLMPGVREMLFRQIEDLIAFEKDNGRTKLKEIDESEDTIIFGLPSCDLDAVLYNDKFFGEREFEDKYYTNARKKLTLITLACITPPNDNCFCASMGHGPFLEKGFDMQLAEIEEEEFIVILGSDKGEKLIKTNEGLFSEAVDTDIKKFNTVKEKASRLPVKDFINKDKFLKDMVSVSPKKEVISEISDRCISCGACNFACPTCTCFTVIDWAKNGKGVRKRILDSCIFSGYFRMAGGHNPNEEKDSRTNNRYYCKLIWDKNKFGDSGCVGCGRCLDSCPVDIDIKEVIRSIA